LLFFYDIGYLFWKNDCATKIISVPYKIPELSRFEVLNLLGQGGFGKVILMLSNQFFTEDI